MIAICNLQCAKNLNAIRKIFKSKIQYSHKLILKTKQYDAEMLLNDYYDEEDDGMIVWHGLRLLYKDKQLY